MRSFLDSRIIVNKVRAYLSGAFYAVPLKINVPYITRKFWTYQKMLARDKHSSLFYPFVSGKEKVYDIDVLKTFCTKIITFCKLDSSIDRIEVSHRSSKWSSLPKEVNKFL